MAKVYDNAIPLATGFTINNPNPLDDKDVVQTFDDLLTLGNAYLGIEVKVQDEEYQKYVWYQGAQNVAGNWRGIAGAATESRVVYVAHDASGTGDGSSWDNGYITINAAVTAAAGGSEIWIKEGTYTLAAAITIDNTKRNLKLFGGFKGAETSKDFRTDVYVTTIDCTNDFGFILSGSDGVVLDRLRMINGTGGVTSSGLQLFANGFSNLTVTNCTFRDCLSGSGAFVTNDGNLFMSGCLFDNNTTHDDADSDTAAAWFSSTTGHITKTVFENNVGRFTAVRIVESVGGDHQTLFTDCDFINNSTYDSVNSSGPISLNENASSIFSRCTFANNQGRTGVIAFTLDVRARLVGCLFYNNTLYTTNNDGLFIVGNDSTITFESCTIVDNGTIPLIGDLGFTTPIDSLTIRNCIIDVPTIITSSLADNLVEDETTIDYSLIQVAWDGTGSNNITGQARFVNRTNHNYHHISDSPALQAGNITSSDLDDYIRFDYLRYGLGNNPILVNDEGLTDIGAFVDSNSLHGVSPDRGISSEALADGGTYTVDMSTSQVKQLNVAAAATSVTLAVSNLSATIERRNKIIINNSSNTSALTVTFNDQSSAITFRRAVNEFPGTYPTMNVAASTIWEVEFENESATVILLDFIQVES